MLNEFEYLIVRPGENITIFILLYKPDIYRIKGEPRYRMIANSRIARFEVPHKKLETGKEPATQLDILIQYLRLQLI